MYNIFSGKGDNMQIFGLIISILFFILLFLLLGFYVFLVIKKKVNFANLVSKWLFLFTLITLAIESWALIMIAGGFQVYLKIGIDYSYTLFIIIPVTIILIVSNILIRRKIKIDSKIEEVGFFLLPPLTILAFGASTIVLFINISYYSYIC